MRLAIVSDSHHYRDAEGRLHNLSILKRQLECWCDLFDEVVLVAPLCPGEPPGTHSPYEAQNIEFVPIAPAGGSTPLAKLRLLLACFSWAWTIASVLRRVDAVHIRCPNNVNFLTLALVKLFSCHRQAVWTGNWSGWPSEPRHWRWNREYLASGFGGPAFVYARGLESNPRLVPTFSPSFSQELWEEKAPEVEEKIAAVRASEGRPEEIRLVSIGHLDRNKNQRTILRAVRLLVDRGFEVTLDLLGEGPERPALEALVRELELEGRAHLRGSVSIDEVFRTAGAAHFSVLASHAEGWPKVVGESMLMGAIPVVSEVSINDYLVGGGTRGRTFPPTEPERLAEAIAEVAGDPKATASMMEAGREFSRGISFEAFREHIRRDLSAQWGVTL